MKSCGNGTPTGGSFDQIADFCPAGKGLQGLGGNVGGRLFGVETGETAGFSIVPQPTSTSRRKLRSRRFAAAIARRRRPSVTLNVPFHLDSLICCSSGRPSLGLSA